MAERKRERYVVDYESSTLGRSQYRPSASDSSGSRPRSPLIVPAATNFENRDLSEAPATQRHTRNRVPRSLTPGPDEASTLRIIRMSSGSTPTSGFSPPPSDYGGLAATTPPRIVKRVTRVISKGGREGAIPTPSRSDPPRLVLRELTAAPDPQRLKVNISNPPAATLPRAAQPVQTVQYVQHFGQLVSPEVLPSIPSPNRAVLASEQRRESIEQWPSTTSFSGLYDSPLVLGSRYATEQQETLVRRVTQPTHEQASAFSSTPREVSPAAEAPMPVDGRHQFISKVYQQDDGAHSEAAPPQVHVQYKTAIVQKEAPNYPAAAAPGGDSAPKETTVIKLTQSKEIPQYQDSTTTALQEKSLIYIRRMEPALAATSPTNKREAPGAVAEQDMPLNIHRLEHPQQPSQPGSLQRHSREKTHSRLQGNMAETAEPAIQGDWSSPDDRWQQKKDVPASQSAPAKQPRPTNHSGPATHPSPVQKERINSQHSELAKHVSDFSYELERFENQKEAPFKLQPMSTKLHEGPLLPTNQALVSLPHHFDLSDDIDISGTNDDINWAAIESQIIPSSLATATNCERNLPSERKRDSVIQTTSPRGLQSRPKENIMEPSDIPRHGNPVEKRKPLADVQTRGTNTTSTTHMPQNATERPWTSQIYDDPMKADYNVTASAPLGKHNHHHQRPPAYQTDRQISSCQTSHQTSADISYQLQNVGLEEKAVQTLDSEDSSEGKRIEEDLPFLQKERDEGPYYSRGNILQSNMPQGRKEMPSQTSPIGKPSMQRQELAQKETDDGPHYPQRYSAQTTKPQSRKETSSQANLSEEDIIGTMSRATENGQRPVKRSGDNSRSASAGAEEGGRSMERSIEETLGSRTRIAVDSVNGRSRRAADLVNTPTKIAGNTSAGTVTGLKEDLVYNNTSSYQFEHDTDSDELQALESFSHMPLDHRQVFQDLTKTAFERTQARSNDFFSGYGGGLITEAYHSDIPQSDSEKMLDELSALDSWNAVPSHEDGYRQYNQKEIQEIQKKRLALEAQIKYREKIKALKAGIRRKVHVDHNEEMLQGSYETTVSDNGTIGMDTIEEHVDLGINDNGVAAIAVKVTAERILPVDTDKDLWRKSSVSVTRTIEIDLLCCEDTRAIYAQLQRAHALSRTPSRTKKSMATTNLGTGETYKIFSALMNMTSEGKTDLLILGSEAERHFLNERSSSQSHDIHNIHKSEHSRAQSLKELQKDFCSTASSKQVPMTDTVVPSHGSAFTVLPSSKICNQYASNASQDACSNVSCDYSSRGSRFSPGHYFETDRELELSEILQDEYELGKMHSAALQSPHFQALSPSIKFLDEDVDEADKALSNMHMENEYDQVFKGNTSIRLKGRDPNGDSIRESGGSAWHGEGSFSRATGSQQMPVNTGSEGRLRQQMSQLKNAGSETSLRQQTSQLKNAGSETSLRQQMPSVVNMESENRARQQMPSVVNMESENRARQQMPLTTLEAQQHNVTLTTGESARYDPDHARMLEEFQTRNGRDCLTHMDSLQSNRNMSYSHNVDTVADVSYKRGSCSEYQSDVRNQGEHIRSKVSEIPHYDMPTLASEYERIRLQHREILNDMYQKRIVPLAANDG